MKSIALSVLLSFLGITTFAQNWTQITPTVSGNFNACWFSPLHPDTGYISGFSIIGGHAYPFVYKTLNGGISLTNQGLALGQSFLNPANMDFTSESTGYIAGWGIIKTSDGGVNWNICLDMGVAGGLLYDINFVSTDTGYCVGQSFFGVSGGYEGQFLYTSDAGVNWTSSSVSAESNFQSSELKAFVRASPNHFYAGGTGAGGAYTTLFESVTGGSTWTALPFYENITAMALASSDTAYFAGELGIYRMCIPQNTITLVQPITGTTINSIRIKDQLGFAVTFNGSIYASGDNGRSWFQMTSPVQGANSLNQISIVSQNEAWAVGSSGTILHYTASSLPVSVTNNETNSQYSICPNPANNYFSVHDASNSSTSFEITIQNIQGSTIFKKRDCNSNEIFSISNLSPGIYSVLIMTGDRFIHKKLMVL